MISLFFLTIFGNRVWASTQENLSSVFANNKGADQPAHPRSLISAFVICLLESIIYKLATSKISILRLVCVVEETGLSLTLFGNPEDRFYRDEGHINPLYTGDSLMRTSANSEVL